MAFSSQNISGLNSSKVGFKVDEKVYQAEGYFSVKEGDSAAETSGTTKWNAELMKECFESWFVGENTGQGATRVSFLFFLSIDLNFECILITVSPCSFKQRTSHRQAANRLSMSESIFRLSPRSRSKRSRNSSELALRKRRT